MKKGSIEMETIVKAILVLVVLSVLIWFFVTYFGNSSNQVECHLEEAKNDYDNDGVKDTFDPCPCDANMEQNPDGSCREDHNKCKKIRCELYKKSSNE